MKPPGYTDEEYLEPIRKTNFLKDVSKDHYITYIQRARDDIKHAQSIDNLLVDPEGFENRLHSYADKKSSRLNTNRSIGNHIRAKIVASIKAIFKYNQTLQEMYPELYQRWDNVLRRTQSKIHEHYQSNMPTSRQREGFIPFEELCQKRDEMEDGTQEKLLLCMYTMIPPARADYYDCRLFSRQPHIDTGNYIVLRENNPILVLNEYKTKKRYGQITIDIPNELFYQIQASLRTLPRDYLFVRPFNHQPFTQCRHPLRSYTKWVNSVLKRHFNRQYASISNVRHAYISRSDLDLPNKTGLQQEEIATKMQHSTDMQRKYYFMNVN